MSYNQENNIKTPYVVYEFSSVLPLGRQMELRTLLTNFSEDWNILFITLYPSEVKKVLNEFPEFMIYILNDQTSSYTISCKICKTLN